MPSLPMPDTIEYAIAPPTYPKHATIEVTVKLVGSIHSLLYIGAAIGVTTKP